MDVNTSSKVINTQQNIQAKAVQPKKKAADQSSEAGSKRNTASVVTDKVSISASGIEAQMNSEIVKGGVKEAPKPRS